MALASYTDLVNSIQSWMFDRPDLAPMCPDFIALAESDFNDALDTRPMVNIITAVLDVNGQTDYPLDAQSIRSITVNSARPHTIELVTVDFIYDGGWDFASGSPKFYTVEGGKITCWPKSNPNAATITINYYQKLPPLSLVMPTNWLLTRKPSAYLYNSLKHACIFIGDPTRAAAYQQLVDRLIGELQITDEQSIYSRAQARAKGPTP